MSAVRCLFASVLLPAIFFAVSANAATTGQPHAPASLGSYTHIHTSTPSAEPAPLFSPFPLFVELDKAYKTAGVCFIGFGNCGDEGFYHKGSSSGSGGGTTGSDNFEIDTAQQCKNEGYTITSCPAGSAAAGICPYNGGYYSGCKSYEELCRQDNYYKTCSGGMVLDPDQSCGYDSSYKKCVSAEEACENEGYHGSCEDGKILDPGQVCSYSSSYQKCVCDPCDGYDYTLEEAQSEGWRILGAACNSCGEKIYMREANPCNGFYTCDNGGEVGAEICMSGEVKMFSSCKEPVESCPDGMVDLDNYWCDNALGCWWTGSSSESCTQTECFEYPYSSVTCKTGMVKESCTDDCVGTRYRCINATGCDGYPLTDTVSCTYGYETCTDTSGQEHYKCISCTPTTDCSEYTLTSQSGCSYGYESCDDGCGNVKYKCSSCTPTTDCSEYTLTSQSGCAYGYESCNDGCENVKYKCGNVCPASISTLEELNMVLSGTCSNRDSQTVYTVANNISGSFSSCSANCNYSFTLNLGGNSLGGNLDFTKMTGGITLNSGIITGSITGSDSASLTLSGITAKSNISGKHLSLTGCTVNGKVTSKSNGIITNSSISVGGCTALVVSGQVNITNSHLTSKQSSYCGYGNGLINPHQKSVIYMTGGTLNCQKSGNHVFNTMYIGYSEGITVNITANNLTLNKYEDDTLTVACP